MSSPETGSLASAEQNTLAILERETNRFIAEIPAMFPRNRPATLQEVKAVIDYAWRIEDWYESFRGAAEHLRQSGSPTVSDRLDLLLKDIRGARETYIEMYKSTVQSIQTISAYQEKIKQEILGIIADVTKHRKEVFDQATEQAIQLLRS